MISQEMMVLDHLKNIGPISQRIAVNRYSIYRLSGRIFNLRRLGYQIDSVWQESINKYGQKVRYVEYVLKGEEDGGEEDVQQDDHRQ